MSSTRAAESKSEGSADVLTREQQHLAAGNLGLVRLHLNNRVPTPAEARRERDYDDLFQVGCLALVRAARRFRPGCDGTFAAYALPRIRGTVHVALHEEFGTIRVPVRAQRAGSDLHDPARDMITSLPRDLTTRAVPHDASTQSADTIRHLLRARFVRAVRTAAREMQIGFARDAHRRAAIERIASERLLVDDEDARTPQRIIADACGLSAGRVCHYEQRLFDRVRRLLRDDPQVPLLVEYARRDPCGYKAHLDLSRLRRLDEADLHDFRRRFDSLPHPQRAECLYDLVHASTPDITEVAANLYRLTARTCMPPGEPV